MSEDVIDKLAERIRKLRWDDVVMVFHLVERLEGSEPVPSCSLRYVVETIGHKETLKRPVCPINPNQLGNGVFFSNSQCHQED